MSCDCVLALCLVISFAPRGTSKKVHNVVVRGASALAMNHVQIFLEIQNFAETSRAKSIVCCVLTICTRLLDMLIWASNVLSPKHNLYGASTVGADAGKRC